ncbi:MAG: hypothetical protein JWM87_4858 [Candidatus Eremiobacteraeota bacterium]|nr:hypothetical protein [Candidatus Eremiobacteraeota bacterium]
MQEAPPALAAWANFYVITGSSAAALTGLMFVVITLIKDTRLRANSEGIATFSTPTVVHFCVALLIAVTLSAPWRSLVPVGVLLALTGLYGVGYTLHITNRARRNDAYQPEFEDWLWYSLLPIAAYVAIVAAAIRLPAVPAGSLFALAGGTVFLVFIGIHNAWDVVTYLAVEGLAKPADSTAKPSDPTVQPDDVTVNVDGPTATPAASGNEAARP